MRPFDWCDPRKACADLLVVDGNPLEDLSSVTDLKNLKVITKGGKICKGMF